MLTLRGQLPTIDENLRLIQKSRDYTAEKNVQKQSGENHHGFSAGYTHL